MCVKHYYGSLLSLFDACPDLFLVEHIPKDDLITLVATTLPDLSIISSCKDCMRLQQ